MVTCARGRKDRRALRGDIIEPDGGGQIHLRRAL